MRVIKFRGRTESGNWVYGNLSILNKGISDFISAGTYISNSEGSPFAYAVNPDTIGQFTGLLDKNGKEIYEGDLMQIGTEKAVVVYSANGFYQEVINDDSVYCNFNSYEVIGSVHDNPELLKGDKE